MGETLWRLFVDESGGFRSRQDASTVAGLLVKSGHPALYAETLEGTLREAVPVPPWPLHTWLLRQPVMYAIWPSMRIVSGGPPLAGAAGRAMAVLESAAPVELKATRERLTAGKEPERASLRRMGRALESRDATAAGALRVAMFTALDRVRRVLAKLAELGDLYLVTSAEARRGDSLDTPDPYCTLLACLFQRVADTLASVGGRHRVELHPMFRFLRDPAAGELVPMTPRRVSEVAARAVGAADRRYRRAGAEVRLVPGQVNSLTPGLPPVLILADYAVNAAREHLKQSQALEIVQTGIEARLAVPLAFPERPGLPHLAASGVAQEHLDRARNGALVAKGLEPDSGPLFQPHVRAWAREQAIAWAREIARA